MTKGKIIKPKQIKVFIKKLPKKMAEKAFLTFLGFFALSLILGGLIFYKYKVDLKPEEIEGEETELKFKSEIYQKILQTWQDKEERFEKINTKQYFNLFIR